jgi:hypothetical protein
MIGSALPGAQVEVVEPFPHPAAIALASSTANVRFVPKLTGSYDLLISTDVFEHVPDPIGLVAATSEYLHHRGVFLIANCFAPVVKCHLPQLFHFSLSWDLVMHHLGFSASSRISYAVPYVKTGKCRIDKARSLAARSEKFYDLASSLPFATSRIYKAAFTLSHCHLSASSKLHSFINRA